MIGVFLRRIPANFDNQTQLIQIFAIWKKHLGKFWIKIIEVLENN